MWIEGIYWCKVVSTIIWAKITLKTSYYKHVNFIVRLTLLVLGGRSMCCPNVGAHMLYIFRSQYLSHMIPNLGGVFPLRKW